MSHPTIYLDRENVLRFRLVEDNATVQAGVITRAIFALPAAAAATAGDELFDTSDEGTDCELVESGTVLVIRAGSRDLIPSGLPYQAHITVFDSESVTGLAWDSAHVMVSTWRPEAP